ncbi:MAG: four helix bundle protein [Kiritimatiellaeota bacterium]|nr:four helix bundle protein [Kiritimatiellota bacterium]
MRIIKLYKYLSSEKGEYVMSKQLLRCGTSIGANAHEARHGQSRKDFLAKMYIAFKESAETEYWLTLLTRAKYLTKRQGESILSDCVEIKMILSSITKTLKTTPTPNS